MGQYNIKLYILSKELCTYNNKVSSQQINLQSKKFN